MLLPAWLAVALAAGGCVSTTTAKPKPKLKPDEAAAANVQLGVAYLRQGELELAEHKLERAVELDPSLATAHTYLALAKDQLGHVDDADRHYRRAIRLTPDDPNLHNLYGAYLCRNDRLREGEKHFLDAASNPRYRTPAAALTNAGICVLKVPDTEAAEGYFRLALDNDPAFADALWQMASLSYSSSRFLQARAFLQRLAEAAAASAPALYLSLQVERELGDDLAARRFERRLIDEFPDSRETARVLEAGRGG